METKRPDTIALLSLLGILLAVGLLAVLAYKRRRREVVPPGPPIQLGEHYGDDFMLSLDLEAPHRVDPGATVPLVWAAEGGNYNLQDVTLELSLPKSIRHEADRDTVTWTRLAPGELARHNVVAAFEATGTMTLRARIRDRMGLVCSQASTEIIVGTDATVRGPAPTSLRALRVVTQGPERVVPGVPLEIAVFVDVLGDTLAQIEADCVVPKGLVALGQASKTLRFGKIEQGNPVHYTLQFRAESVGRLDVKVRAKTSDGEVFATGRHRVVVAD